MNLLMFEKICVYENVLLVVQNIFCPTNPIYGRVFALHADYVPMPVRYGHSSHICEYMRVSPPGSGSWLQTNH